MIDWNLTKEKFGEIDLNSYRPKVMCKCDICNDTTKQITIRVKSLLIDNQMKWECTRCIGNKEETIVALKEARVNGSKNKDSNAYKYWVNNKDKLLKDSAERRRLKSKQCTGCNETFDISNFFVNNTYISPHCYKCEELHKAKRHREIALYTQKWHKDHKTKKQTSYSGTTEAKCYSENFNNINYRTKLRCEKLNIPNDLTSKDYKAILENNKTINGCIVCTYCKKELFVFCFEHKTPLSRGGTNTIDNLAISCVDCNQSKHNLTYDEFQSKMNNVTIFEQVDTGNDDTLFSYSTNIPVTWKYPIWSNHDLQDDLKLVVNYEPTGSLVQTKSSIYGYSIMQHFHKSFWHSTPKGCKPISDAFNDPTMIQNLLSNLDDDRRLSYKRLLREIFYKTDYKYPGLFAPHLATEILSKFANNGDTVYDPCAGWGGRWLGSINRKWNYIASDPNEFIRNENIEIADYFDLDFVIDNKKIGDDKDVKADIIFTSPPWGDSEYYFGGDDIDDNLMELLLVESKKLLKNNNSLLILHLPKAPENYSNRYTQLKISSRGRYNSSSNQSIFVWKKEDL